MVRVARKFAGLRDWVWEQGGVRAFSLFLCFTLLYSSAAPALNESAVSLFGFIQQALKQRPGPYTDIPRPVVRGADWRREPKTRGGVGETSYTYDNAGRLTGITNPHSEDTSFTYDAGNRLTRKDVESGAYEATSYDTRNRVTEVLLKNSSNSTLRTQSWTYDYASNVATMTQASVTTTYGYDDIDQLTSESRSGYSASYTYDANGNRATKVLGGVTQNYTYDDADKLDYIQVSGSTTKDYSYDAAGRTTSVAVTGVGTTTLAYDYEGRITTITYPNSSTNTYTYNGLDTRVGKVDSGGTKTLLRDGAGVTSPVLSDGAANYTPGISERRSSTTTYTHSGFKNGESQTGSGQTVLASQTFDAFGNPDTPSGTWKGPFGYGGPFGYQTDSDSGLMLLGHRYYDASTGRFLTRDPAKHGRNWYAYCSGSPTSYADSRGQSPGYAAIAHVYYLDDYYAMPPPMPPGVDIDKIIRDQIDTVEDPPLSPMGDAELFSWGKYVGTVAPGGKSDHKLRDEDREKYDDAGNFQYGALSAAMRVPLSLALDIGEVDSQIMYGKHDDQDDIYWTKRGYRYYKLYFSDR